MRLLLFLGIWAAVGWSGSWGASGLRAGLKQVERAQALLGEDVWSRVIVIENTRPGKVYRQQVPGLVFELMGILWLYVPAEGTRSLSTHLGRQEADKADFGPLLRELHEGFGAWREVVAPERRERVARSGRRGRLRNGCFVESVAILRDRLAAGQDARRPRLLLYYGAGSGAGTGHAVVTFETDEGVNVIDPLSPRRVTVRPLAEGEDARELAEAVVGHRLSQARWVPLDEFLPEVAKNALTA